MKSDVIAVSNKQDNIEQVLSQTDRVASYRDLSHKGALHLRLLAEEMMNMMRALVGEAEGQFWIESEGDQFTLHLKAKTVVDPEAREKLLSVSTTGRNEAHRGFTGKIRAFFEPFETAPFFLDPDLAGAGADLVWSMRVYEQQLIEYVRDARDGAAEAWDELEKSVIAHVADDVKVSVRNGEAEMIVSKQLS